MSGEDIIDAEWEDVPDAQAHSGSRPDERRSNARLVKSPPTQTRDSASPWRSKEFWYDTVGAVLRGIGQVALIVAGCMLLIFLAIAWYTHNNTPASEPMAASAPVEGGAQQDGEQMLRSWTQAVTGKSDAAGFAMVDGSGKPGDFCNNSDGDTMLKFGGETTGYDESITIYDFFAEFHGQSNSGTIGAFWYDADAGSLLTRNQAEVSGDGKKGESLPDIVHEFDADGAGRATIDGTSYHVCII